MAACPCRRLPHSFVSVCLARTRWKAPLLLGCCWHICATELRTTRSSRSQDINAHFTNASCVKSDSMWSFARWGYLFDPGVFSGDWHTVESLSLCSYCVFRVKIHLQMKHSLTNKLELKWDTYSEWVFEETHPAFCHVFILPTSQRLWKNKQKNRMRDENSYQRLSKGCTHTNNSRREDKEVRTLACVAGSTVS